MSIMNLTPKDSYVKKWSLNEMTYLEGGKVGNPFDLTMEEESKSARLRAFECQDGWMLTRLLVFDAQKAIVDNTFDFRGKSVAEFGSGSHGWFYNFMLPKRKNWVQFDINPKIVENNREFSRRSFSRFPKVQVGDIYNMPLESESVDVIFGLSSWDSIYFFERSAEEVERCLKSKGYFVHLQDLMPAEGPLLLTEARKRKEKGMETTFPVRVMDEIIPCEFGYKRMSWIFGIDSIDWGEVRLGQYLVNQLREVFNNRGFDIKSYGGIEKEVLVKERNFRKRIENLTKKSLNGIPNSLGYAYGKFCKEENNSVPKGKIKQWAYMDVFVAQKQ